MKKILSIVAGGFALAITISSCMNGNSAEQTARDNAAIDSLSNTKLAVLRDSLYMSCNMLAMDAAKYKADSVIASLGKKGSGSSKPKPKPEPKKDDKPGVGNRPGTQQDSKPTINNRPGTTNDPATQPKVNKRPGATTNTPPKN